MLSLDTFVIPRGEFEGIYSFSTSLQPVSHYVARIILQQQIKARLHDSPLIGERVPKILLLHRLGGTGKSQLALNVMFDKVRFKSMYYYRGDIGSV
jgi:hypothetical protein